MEEYKHDIPKLEEPVLPELDPYQFYRRLQKRPRRKAGGFDAWLTAEARVLPLAIVALFTEVFKVVEGGNGWVEAWSFVPKVALVKADTGKPLDTRLIGLASVWTSTYEGLRYRHLSRWREGWLCPRVFGARRSHRTVDISYPFQLYGDVAVAQQKPWLGLLLDRQKCFDRLVFELMFGVQEAYRCPAPVVRYRRGFYGEQWHFLRIANCYSDPFSPTNGAIQGSVSRLTTS